MTTTAATKITRIQRIGAALTALGDPATGITTNPDRIAYIIRGYCPLPNMTPADHGVYDTAVRTVIDKYRGLRDPGVGSLDTVVDAALRVIEDFKDGDTFPVLVAAATVACVACHIDTDGHLQDVIRLFVSGDPLPVAVGIAIGGHPSMASTFLHPNGNPTVGEARAFDVHRAREVLMRQAGEELEAVRRLGVGDLVAVRVRLARASALATLAVALGD